MRCNDVPVINRPGLQGSAVLWGTILPCSIYNMDRIA